MGICQSSQNTMCFMRTTVIISLGSCLIRGEQLGNQSLYSLRNGFKHVNHMRSGHSPKTLPLTRSNHNICNCSKRCHWGTWSVSSTKFQVQPLYLKAHLHSPMRTAPWKAIPYLEVNMYKHYILLSNNLFLEQVKSNSWF